MTCGLCGSGISADEKYKKLKTARSILTSTMVVSKARDKSCKCGYLNETELIKQLQSLVDKVELKENTVLENERGGI